MRRPTFRLAVLMEWVAALAVGFALLRWVDTEHVSIYDDNFASSILIMFQIPSVLMGIAITEFAMLGWESLRHRRPPIWGLGRWTWASTGIYLFLAGANALTNTARAFLYQWQSGRPIEISEIWVSVRSYGGDFLAHGLNSTFPEALVAGAIAARLARWPRDLAPDSREWSGRIFAVVLLGLAVVLNVGGLIFIALGLQV